jgi:hypothetical protein
VLVNYPYYIIEETQYDDDLHNELGIRNPLRESNAEANGSPDNDFTRVHFEDRRFYEALSKNKKKTCDVKQSLAFK